MPQTTETVQAFLIKFRKRGEKAYWFLSSQGRMSRLRVHAIQFSERTRADTCLAQLLTDNPEYEGKITS